MSTVLFSRTTERGDLECRLNGVEPEFYLNGEQIKKTSIAGIHSIDYLAGKQGYAAMFEQLQQVGANAVWNLQVALYGNEAERIEAAVAIAKEQAHQDELAQIADSDIEVTQTLYNGTPAMAENPLFRWHFMNADTLFCKVSGRAIYQMSYLRYEGGSDDITDPDTKAAVLRFHHELDLMKKHAETAYEDKQTARLRAEAEDFYARNPRLKGLTKAEVDCKAEEWDRLYNEGGEGYNPYRSV